MMKQIFVYSDSQSWGIIPLTRQRMPFEQRWVNILERLLNEKGESVRCIEDCLNGRRTVFEDPFRQGRNGLIGLAQKIEIHSPLDLIIILLGNNDFQSVHNYDLYHSAQGIATLVAAIRNAPVEPGIKIPRILVIAPPALQEPKGPIALKFTNAPEKSKGLSEAYARICQEIACDFWDANQLISASKTDGVHLDVEQHQQLAEGLVNVVMDMI